MARTGRRRGKPDTRAVILHAARDAFADRGFDGASIRQIAAAADVDPALVHHYFGTKDDLFLAAMEIPIDPAKLLPEVLAGDRDTVGPRLVAMFVGVWDGPAGTPALAMVRTMLHHEWGARLVREFVIAQILRRVVSEYDIPDAEVRVPLVASQLFGLVMARYLVRLEPLASAPAPWIVATVGPTIQRYLTADLPALATTA